MGTIEESSRPKMTVQKLAELQGEQLSKQPPTSLEEMKAQVKWMQEQQYKKPIALEEKRLQALKLKVRDSSYSGKAKENDIKRNLRVYHPEWTEQQVHDEYLRLMSVYGAGEI